MQEKHKPNDDNVTLNEKSTMTIFFINMYIKKSSSFHFNYYIYTIQHIRKFQKHIKSLNTIQKWVNIQIEIGFINYWYNII
jgi:hypothetical protein